MRDKQTIELRNSVLTIDVADASFKLAWRGQAGRVVADLAQQHMNEEVGRIVGLFADAGLPPKGVSVEMETLDLDDAAKD